MMENGAVAILPRLHFTTMSATFGHCPKKAGQALNFLKAAIRRGIEVRIAPFFERLEDGEIA